MTTIILSDMIIAEDKFIEIQIAKFVVGTRIGPFPS